MTLTVKNIHNIFIYTMPRFAQYGMQLLVLPILTRVLNPQDFGVVTLAMLLPTVLVNVITGGLSSAVPRFYFEYRNDKSKLNMLYYSSQLYLFVVLIISLLIVYYTKEILSKLVMGSSDYGLAIFVSFITVSLTNMNSLYLRIYQSMEKAAIYAFFVLMQVVVSVSVSILLVCYFKMSYMGVIYGSLSGAFISWVSCFCCFNKHVQMKFSGKMLIENITYGIQVVPKTFTGFINRYFDKYMLNAVLSMSIVGVYSVGQSIANAIDTLLSNVWMSFEPVALRVVFDNKEEASRHAGRLFTVYAYANCLPIIIIILFARDILRFMAPPTYYQATDVIVILMVGIATQSFGRYVGIQYAYSKKPFWIFPVTVIGSIINVILNIILIPHYGFLGAGCAVMISTGIVNVLLTCIGQKLYKIQYEWKTIGLLYSLIVGAAITVLSLSTLSICPIYYYSIKVFFFLLFVCIGIHAKIITKQSINKVVSPLFSTRMLKVEPVSNL